MSNRPKINYRIVPHFRSSTSLLSYKVQVKKWYGWRDLYFTYSLDTAYNKIDTFYEAECAKRKYYSIIYVEKP